MLWRPLGAIVKTRGNSSRQSGGKFGARWEKKGTSETLAGGPTPHGKDFGFRHGGGKNVRQLTGDVPGEIGGFDGAEWKSIRPRRKFAQALLHKYRNPLAGGDVGIGALRRGVCRSFFTWGDWGNPRGDFWGGPNKRRMKGTPEGRCEARGPWKVRP